MGSTTLLQLDLPGIQKIKSGKVREVFDLGEYLLFVATDRISAFDCVMPNGIPRKGEVLTQLSHFWFDLFGDIVPNHRALRFRNELPGELREFESLLQRRSMVVEKATPLPIECVVRGYLAGSGWVEYQRNQHVCGVALPPGLRESDQLPSPIFTPATKADTGHDENISFETATSLVGTNVANQVRELSLALYNRASHYARERGIIIADTKFEFGLQNDRLILIDEVLTPDSSRFWPALAYQPGQSQSSFDKQFVRDYLSRLSWDKTPPAPALPDAIVQNTQAKYFEAFRRLTGCEL